jgi:hypothetical protein
VKAMDKKSEGFASLRQKFPRTGEAKMKEGIFLWATNGQIIRPSKTVQKEEPGKHLKICRISYRV